MKIIYTSHHCWPLPILACTIHNNLLRNDSIDINLDIVKKHYYKCKDIRVQTGEIVKISNDVYGNEIFVLGSSNIGTVIERAVIGFNKILGDDEIKFVFLDEYNSLLYKMAIKMSKFSFFTKLSLHIINLYIHQEKERLINKVITTTEMLH